jgi:hypothetical protein
MDLVERRVYKRIYIYIYSQFDWVWYIGEGGRALIVVVSDITQKQEPPLFVSVVIYYYYIVMNVLFCFGNLCVTIYFDSLSFC